MHVKYDTSHLSLSEKRVLIMLARIRGADWWVDVLDCSKSFARQRIDMPFDEIFPMLNEKCYFTIIHREQSCGFESPCLEIAFSTFTEPDYFLWMRLGVEHLAEFTAGLMPLIPDEGN